MVRELGRPAIGAFMTPQLRTKEAVLRAVREYDQLGQEPFLQKYGFRRSKQYLLRIDGREYDSKAIVGVAFGFEHPERGPLRSGEFSGGIGGVGAAAAQLVRLGFEVVGPTGGLPVRSAIDRSSSPALRPAPREPGPTRPALATAPARTLIVLPCSGAKSRRATSDRPGLSISDEIEPSLAKELRHARQRLLELGGHDERERSPAVDRYAGTLYKAGGPGIRRLLEAGTHVAIVSGGYGVVLAEEPIGLYDRRFKSGDWPRKLAGRVLASYAERHDLETVLAFLARTTSYAEVVRSAPWGSQVKRVELVSADHAGGGGMRVVPETLGEAIGQYARGGIPLGWTSRRGIGLHVERVIDRPDDSESVDTSPIARRLLDAKRHRLADFEQDRTLATEAGLYAWYGDEVAQSLIERALGGLVGALLYVGQAGATKWPSGTSSNATLGSRIRSQHIGGNTGTSTLRRTLAAALGPGLGLKVADGVLDRTGEQQLRDFMREHLEVAVLPISDRGRIGEIEAAVVRELDPPLNLDHLDRTDARRRLRVLRSSFGKTRSKADEVADRYH
jgi:hypothetical protein